MGSELVTAIFVSVDFFKAQNSILVKN